MTAVAKTPEQAHYLFVQFFNEGNVEALLSLYDPNAILVSFPDPPVSGHAEIRKALEGFLAMKCRMVLNVDKVFSADGVGLLFSTWSLSGSDENGDPILVGGQTSDVVRRQADGSWLFVIDNPQGAATTKD